MPESEYDRQYRVLDQMISMHSSLAQIYERRALVLNCGLLLASAFLCSVTFAPDDILDFTGITPKVSRMLIGLASVVAFGLSIIELKVKWDVVAAGHANAAKILSELKAGYRNCWLLEGEARSSAEASLTVEYNQVMQNIVPISGDWFNALKSEHLFKKSVSQQLDMHPHVPVWLVKLKLRVRGVWLFIRG